MGPLKAALPLPQEQDLKKQNAKPIAVQTGESSLASQGSSDSLDLTNPMIRHSSNPYLFIIDGLKPPTQGKPTQQIGGKIGKPIADLYSPYWDTKSEMDVDIDGHDFDFVPDKNIGKANVEGEVDGPLWHNGRFRVRKNDAENFTLEVNVGTNDAQNNDMHVNISIKEGKATIKGRIQDINLPREGLVAKVLGEGTREKPFEVSFKDRRGEAHAIRWRKND